MGLAGEQAMRGGLEGPGEGLVRRARRGERGEEIREDVIVREMG